MQAEQLKSYAKPNWCPCKQKLSESINTVLAQITLGALMPIQQVSVFLDNKPGTLSEMLAHLDNLQIKIYALSIAEAGEFGVIRMITAQPEKASQTLDDANFNLAKSKKNTEVTAILVTEKNPISKITKILSENSVNIEYAYSSAVHYDGKFVLVVKPKEVEKAEKALKQNEVTILTLEEIKQHFQ
jgi:hypothetical protein